MASIRSRVSRKAGKLLRKASPAAFRRVAGFMGPTSGQIEPVARRISKRLLFRIDHATKRFVRDHFKRTGKFPTETQIEAHMEPAALAADESIHRYAMAVAVRRAMDEMGIRQNQKVLLDCMLKGSTRMERLRDAGRNVPSPRDAVLLDQEQTIYSSC